MCPAGSPREGLMFATHIRFWANSYVLFIFALAGEGGCRGRALGGCELAGASYASKPAQGTGETAIA